MRRSLLLCNVLLAAASCRAGWGQLSDYQANPSVIAVSANAGSPGDIDASATVQALQRNIQKAWLSNLPSGAVPPATCAAGTHSRTGLTVIDITFASTGKITGMKLSSPSEDTSQNRIAWASLRSLDPATGIVFLDKQTFRVAFCYS